MRVEFHNPILTAESGFRFEDTHVVEEFIQVSPIEAQDFIFGCREIAVKLQGINPDVVFFPERGAIPIHWVLDELKNGEPSSYRSIFLPIGTAYKPGERNWGGFSWDQKTQIVRQSIETLHHNVEAIKNPTVIDEVQSGGTLSFLAPILFSELSRHYASSRLNVIAAKDDGNRRQQIQVKKMRQMLAQRFPELPTSLTLLSLFSTDKNPMLNTLREDTTVDPNILAETIFRLLEHVMFDNDLQTERSQFLYQSVLNAEVSERLTERFDAWLYQVRELSSR